MANPMSAASAAAAGGASAAAAAAASPAPAAAKPAAAGAGAGAGAGSEKEELLLVCLRSDYPAKQVVTRVSSLLTVGGLRAECGTQLGLSAQHLASYDLRTCSYGSDVVSLGVKGEHQCIGEAGVRQRATVFALAPAALKPVTRVAGAGKKKAKGKDKKKKKDTAEAKDKYAGFSEKTIMRVLVNDELKGDDDKQKAALEFFDIYCAKAIQTPDWLKASPELLVQLVKREQLNVPEADLFEAVLRWGAKAKQSNGSGGDLKETLKDVLPHIRFPTMAIGDIASKVVPTGLLTPEQQLAVFTYAGSSKKDDQKVGGGNLPWPTRVRIGRRPPSWFTWDPARKGHALQLSDDKMTASTARGTNWNSVYATTAITDDQPGPVEWELVLTEYDTSNSYNVVVGLAPADHTNHTHQSIVGYDPNQAPGWGFITGNGHTVRNSSQVVAFGAPANHAGAVVRCRVDLKKHTFEIWVNGAPQGAAFKDVYGPVRPALSLTQQQRVTLRFPAPGSASASSNDAKGADSDDD